MRSSLSFVPATILVALVSIRLSYARTYASIGEYHLPNNNGVLADPDGILTDVGRQAVVDRIQSSCQNLTVSIQRDGKSQGDDNNQETVPVQIAVAVVDQIDTGLADGKNNLDKMVEKFAVELHNKWGIGHQTKDGGTGVLILVDICDQVIFISRGEALEDILTDNRLLKIIEAMKYDMAAEQYDIGLVTAVDAIAGYVQYGKQSKLQKVVDSSLPYLLFVVFGFYAFFAEKNKRMRRYAQLKSELSGIDRTRAEALKGIYCQQDTCSICLEQFKSNTVGSDDNPVKLLRCGHIFDETCWSKWVSSGRGAFNQCPICRADVVSSSTKQLSHEFLEEGAVESVSSSPISTFTIDNANDARSDIDGPMRLHQQERQFRLIRMSVLFPEYISPEQVVRFGSHSYEGQMAQDPSIVVSDPSNRIEFMSNARTSAGEFAGGQSAGGVGGQF